MNPIDPNDPAWQTDDNPPNQGKSGVNIHSGDWEPADISKEGSLRRGPDWISRFGYRPALEIGGMVGGAALGAPIAGAAATVPGVGVPLAAGVEFGAGGLGYGAGGAVADEIDRLRNMQAGPRGNELKNFGYRTAIGTALGPISEAVGSAAGAVAKPLSQEFLAGIKDVASRYGIPMTAASLTGSPTLSRIESVLAKLPISGGVMADFYKKRLDAIGQQLEKLTSQEVNPEIVHQTAQNLTDKLKTGVDAMARSVSGRLSTGLPDETVGRNVASALSNTTKSAMDEFRSRYAQLGDLLPPEAQQIPLPNTAAQVAKLEAEQGGTLPSLQSSKLQAILKDFSKSDTGLPPEWEASEPGMRQALIAAIKAQGQAPEPLAMNLQDFLRNRSGLSDAILQHNAALGTPNAGTKFMSDKTGGALSSILNAMDKDLAQHAENVGGDFGTAFKRLQADYHNVSQTVNSKYFQQILKTQNPSTIVDLAMQPGHAQDLQKLYASLNPSDADTLSAAITNRLLESKGSFNPVELEGRLGELGPDSLSVIYRRSPETLQALQGLTHLDPRAPLPVGDPNFRTWAMRLSKTNPNAVSSFLLQPNNGGNINRLRAIVGEDAFRDLQDSTVFNLTRNRNGEVDLQSLQSKLNKIGPDTVGSILGPEKTQALSHLSLIGRGLSAAEKPGANPSGTGQTMGMMGIMYKLFNSPLSVLKFLTGLPEMAHGYLSPSFQRYATQGLMNPTAASAIGKAGTRLLGNLAGDQVIENQQ